MFCKPINNAEPAGLFVPSETFPMTPAHEILVNVSPLAVVSFVGKQTAKIRQSCVMMLTINEW